MSKKKINLFKNKLPIIFVQKCNNEPSFILSAEQLSFVLKILKKSILFQFKMLSCISGIDYYNALYRFSIAYDLLSTKFNIRIRLKIFLNQLESASSIINIFTSANWWEREIWDLFGIMFKNHFDLRRILLDYGFDGYPMRKDYPVYGLTEIYYNMEEKRIASVPTELTQEFRIFAYDNPWEHNI